MILTYKIKHGRDFTVELAKARQVAEYALKNGPSSSALVKHLGLKAVVANQILRKYGRDKKIKKVSKVKLIVPGQEIKVKQQDRTLYISCLKLTLIYHFTEFVKVNQVELDNEYAYVSVTVPEKPPMQPEAWLGVDLNTTGYCAVAANPSTGKVLKLGKEAYHIHRKYKAQRRNLQKKGKNKLVKKIKNRESRKIQNLNHQISRRIVDYALENKTGIVLEDLTGIRKRKTNKEFKGSLNSWSFYQLSQFIEYKAKLLGVPVVKIDPAYTSQQCSRCGLLGTRNGKKFKCTHCGHVDDADVNAAFVISLRHQCILQLPVDRGAGKGSTDTPKEATA
jgi:putative transposase